MRVYTVRTAKSTYNHTMNIELGQKNCRLICGSLRPIPACLWRSAFRWVESLCWIRPGYDLIHTFNAIPVAPMTPFIVTFEDYLPRLPPDRPSVGWIKHHLQRMLGSPSCRAILAMSHYAIQEFTKQNCTVPFFPLLQKKVRLCYPSVSLSARRPKKLQGVKLRLMSVGKPFLRKGIPAVVMAHKLLKKEGIPVETTIVTPLNWSKDEYIGPNDEQLALQMRNEIVRSDIHLMRCLPNGEVLKLMAQHDFLLFPSFHDTFGYVAIESLSCATPVIATNTCALPEIIDHGKNGFLLPFQNDSENLKWKWLYKKEHPDYCDAFMAQIKEFGASIYETLTRFWQERSSYDELSANALLKAQRMFNRESAAQFLENLYEESVGSAV
ncbi:glycosyltransferase family 4 protein [bacterium]|nr:glycosyltransferase family 4 protein [candidate division CSSED10-310 bacterium]